MKNKLMYFFIIFIYIIFAGCSQKETLLKNKKFPPKQSFNYMVDNGNESINLYEALNSQYNEWRGTKYKFGGNTKSGVDCSAFVQRTYKDKLNIRIPRTTALQSKVGKDISIDELEMGDLIFFKTGFNSRHVGIYLEEGKFLHASTKKGVTISRLDNHYYSKHFWKIKRIIYWE